MHNINIQIMWNLTKIAIVANKGAKFMVAQYYATMNEETVIRGVAYSQIHAVTVLS